MDTIDKDYGFRAQYSVDDNFILPKCVGIFEVTANRGIEMFVNVADESNWHRIAELRRDARNRHAKIKSIYGDMLYISDIDLYRMLEDPTQFKTTVSDISGPFATRFDNNHRMNVVGFSIQASFLMKIMCDIYGIPYESEIGITANKNDGTDDFIWRRFALAYSVIGPNLACVEYSGPFHFTKIGRGMSLYFSFCKPADDTIIRLYVYDMSSQSMRNFLLSPLAGPDVFYGARVVKREPGSVPGMYDTLRPEDFANGNAEAFHSSAFYLRVAASVDMKRHRYEIKRSGTIGPYNPFKPHPYGWVSGDIAEYKGLNCARYNNLKDTSKLAIFVHHYVHEWDDVWLKQASGYYYSPSYLVAFPPNEPSRMYATSHTLSVLNGGPIIQQMPGHMFFADISQIDKHLKDKFNYDPRARFLENEGN